MNSKKILIVEDQEYAAIPLKYELEDEGYDVCPIAFSSEAALSIAKDEKPDLILMDISIYGKKSGLEAAKIIQDTYQIPVFFMTGDYRDETIEKIKAARPLGYMIKPLDVYELLNIIKKALMSMS